MKLSVVIPAKNEEGSVILTLAGLTAVLQREAIPYEIIVVDDKSTDSTGQIVRDFAQQDAGVRVVYNAGRSGFGMAIRCGLNAATGDAMAVMMADSSDSPEDLVVYYRTLEEGYDCAFGSRFMQGSKIIDYPKHKLLINRAANYFIRVLFRLPYNDVTNAFKCYRREVVLAMDPLISPHFNLTVEMPLKAVIRGFTYKIVPISWTNRKYGVSKLKLKEMGSRYLFIVLYLWLEKYLALGDYHRRNLPQDEKVPQPQAKHV
jgi:dolichol-phosphate mannosyltransferase